MSRLLAPSRRADRCSQSVSIIQSIGCINVEALPSRPRQEHGIPIGEHMESESKCPVAGDARKHTQAGAPSNAGWWPRQLKLDILHQRSRKSDPMGEEFDYAAEFKSLDLNAVVEDLH